MTKTLPEQFHSLVDICIDEKGVYPHQGIVLNKDGKLEMLAMDLPIHDVFREVFRAIVIREAQEVVFALDRSTREGQGTTLGDVLTGWHWKDGKWATFIIEYQNEPRIVKPIEWNNEFWNQILSDEIEKVQSTVRRIKTPVVRVVRNAEN